MANGILAAQSVVAQKVNISKKMWSDSIPDHWTQVLQLSALPTTQ